MAGSDQYQKEIEALGVVLGALADLEGQGQQFVLQTVANRLGLGAPQVQTAAVGHPDEGADTPALQTTLTSHTVISGSADPEPDPKHFVDEKRPTTDVERVICLAFFLSHHRGQRHFKTADVSKLNTDAAQPDLSNTSQSMKQATDKGLLANAKKKGEKQLSTFGEKYVNALPDRAAVKEVEDSESKRRRRKSSTKKTAQKRG
ncbi:MAG: hypothetical protein R3C59_26110 [Planctomycetaceae bacterium]